MSTIAIFHSVLGVRPGITSLAERWRAAGHRVDVVDQYEGRVFDDYESASSFADEITFPVLMDKAVEGVRELDDDFVAVGFSNGAGMAQWVACQRRVRACVLFGGALPLAVLGVEAWPAGTAVQIHQTVDDPYRDEGVALFAAEVRAAGAPIEVFDYPGSGHLFTDPSLPDEYDADTARQALSRADAFVA